MLMPSNIDWSQLYFTSEALPDEPFEDVSIVTLKSLYVDMVTEEARARIREQTTVSTIEQTMAQIMLSGEIYVHEHVAVSNSGIIVYVEVDDITPDTNFEAMSMLAIALEKLGGKTGQVDFGKRVTYKKSDIVWLNTH